LFCYILAIILTRAKYNNRVNLGIIDAVKFQEVAEQYNIRGIPVTIINGKEYIFGALREDDFIKAFLGRITDDRITDE
jgi:hypothetical protein